MVSPHLENTGLPKPHQHYTLEVGVRFASRLGLQRATRIHLELDSLKEASANVPCCTDLLTEDDIELDYAEFTEAFARSGCVFPVPFTREDFERAFWEGYNGVCEIWDSISWRSHV
jgi:hypothetical protein